MHTGEARALQGLHGGAAACANVAGMVGGLLSSDMILVEQKCCMLLRVCLSPCSLCSQRVGGVALYLDHAGVSPVR